MTPEEKFNRLMSPRCLEDYHISLSEKELRTFKDGRDLLCGVRKMQRSRRNAERILCQNETILRMI